MIRTIVRAAARVGIAATAAVVLAAAPAEGTTPPPPPDLLTGATSTNQYGTVYCDSKGYFDNGRISVELSGYAQAADQLNTAAINVTCQLRQGTIVLATSRTSGGSFSATSTTGSIPMRPTSVCASGFVVPTDGSANHPIPRVCTPPS